MVKLNTEEIKKLQLFARSTGVPARDVIEDGGKVYFFVRRESVGAAIGRNGRVVAALARALRRDVVILAHSDDVNEFLHNILGPESVINIEDKRAIVRGGRKDRVAVARAALARHFGIKLVVR